MFEESPYTTMSITSFGPSTIPKPEKKGFQIKSTNDISDIDGAKPAPKYKQFLNKPQFLQSDVIGSTSKELIRGRNCRDNTLYIDDIEGTRHTIKDRMMRTGRHVNPLVPAYPLPSCVPTENPVPKFIKDPQNHDDIEGSHVIPKRIYDTRDTMSVNDIEGAQANWRPYYKSVRLSNPPIDVSDVSDITAKNRFVDRSTRQTDPCNPYYKINGMEYYDDKYTKPKKLKSYIADNHLLQTKDITGATPGWEKGGFERREWRNTNVTQDIEGAQADSTKHSITTKRQINPLTPVYQSLDPGDLLLPLIPPLIPPSLIKVPTVPPTHGASSLDMSKTNHNYESAHHEKSYGNKSTNNSNFSNSHGISNTQALQDTMDNEFDPVSIARDDSQQIVFKSSSAAHHASNKELQLNFSTSGINSNNSNNSNDIFGNNNSNNKAAYLPPSGRINSNRNNNNNNGNNSVNFNFTSSGNSGRLPDSGRRVIGNNNNQNTNNNFSSTSPALSSRNNNNNRGGGSGAAAGNSGNITPKERRAMQERLDEINLVRQLSM